MSTVTIHEEVPGVVTSATDFNTTLTSWNTATAAGAINEANLREEGIARKNVADFLVDSPLTSGGDPRRGTDWFVEASGGVAGGPYGAGVNVVVVNGTTIQIGPTDVLTDDIVRVYCTAYVRSASPDSQTLVALQRKIGAGAWATIPATQRPLSVSPACVGCAMERVYSVVHRANGTTGLVRWRLVIVDSPGADVYVDNAVLFVTVTGR